MSHERSDPISRATFRRLLRRLSDAEFRRFVADLWEARGWKTTLEEHGVIATRERANANERVLRTISLPVVRLPFRRIVDGSECNENDVVIVNRPASERTETTARENGARLLDADDLYELAFYGIDRATLEDIFHEYFGRSSVTGPPSGMAAVRAAAPDRVTTVLSGNAPITITLVIVLVSALVVGGYIARTTSVDTSSVVATNTSDQIATVAEPLESSPAPTTSVDRLEGYGVCGPPSPDTPPWKLRPVISEADPRSELKGWWVETSLNVSVFSGPNSQPTPLTPEVKHVTTYVDPQEDRYRLEISRWTSTDDAQAMGDFMAPRWHEVMVWGQYTFTINVFTENGTLLTEPSLSMAISTFELLSSVREADGEPIRSVCVAELRHIGS